MKLSFSAKSTSTKPNSKPKPSQGFGDESSHRGDEPNHKYVTEFDGSKTRTLGDSKKKIVVIPPKENEWRPYKKMKNLDLPSIRSADGQPLEFEVESDIAPNKADPAAQMSYGLNLRESNGKGSENGGVNSVDAILLKKLKSDLDSLPEDEGFEQFDEVPVEGFGAALLAGYGWHEGRGIGKNAKEDVKVVEYKRRTSKEGLGFVGDHSANNKVGADGGGKKREKESKPENKGTAVGKEVRIIGGREMGLKGRVVEVSSGGDSLVLRLSISEAEVTVHVNDVAELGSAEEDKCLKKLKELKIQAYKDDEKRSDKKGKDVSERNESRKSRGSDRRGDGGEIKHERGHREERSSNKVSWLRSHIRVRIISKDFKRGRFYLKKGEVVDVVGPTTCDISMDDGREIVQGVDQDILETALPRRGGPVLVLLGKHKGAYGSLVEKDSERETGVVQDADTRELLHVQLEQIAEYVGDPSYIGY